LSTDVSSFESSFDAHSGGACPWCCRIAAEGPSNSLLHACDGGSADDWLWAPCAAELEPECPAAAADVLAHFQWHWQRRQPVVVRNVKGKAEWTQDLLGKLLQRSTYTVQKVDGSALRCADKGQRFLTSLYDGGGELLRVSDFPKTTSMMKLAPRLCADFLDSLPFKAYTNPNSVLNLVSHMPPDAVVKPDLGPKLYAASGRPEERGDGDSLTLLHQDMADAVNVLLQTGSGGGEASVCAGPWATNYAELSSEAYADSLLRSAQLQSAFPWLKLMPDVRQPVTVGAFSNGPAGAVWHLFRTSDRLALNGWLLARAAAEKASDTPREVFARPPAYYEPGSNPVHSQAFFLTSSELQALENETGIRPWTVEQRTGDAVFIPAGCPHQVRNLVGCVKLAVDFVSPESLRECAVLTTEFAADKIPDKLQAKTILLCAAQKAAQALGHNVYT
jgi:lysine-specific demethylase 3